MPYARGMGDTPDDDLANPPQPHGVLGDGVVPVPPPQPVDPS